MNQFELEFIAQSKSFLLEDFLVKIERAVQKMTDEQIWWRANEESNSVGNLLLHLTGNVRQWIISGIGGAQDNRFRQGEFDERNQISGAELLANLRKTVEEASAILGSLNAAGLLEKRLIQGRDTTVLSAIYHVVEHFAMHTGQIIFVAKMFAGDMKFYEDAGGLAIPNWRNKENDRPAL
ncbi:MAG: DUF1572 domain-containing protein [Acidobacteriota bacterium]|nr:DUF1572 domain-containing protein [Acidobacteriota bacterium]